MLARIYYMNIVPRIAFGMTLAFAGVLFTSCSSDFEYEEVDKSLVEKEAKAEESKNPKDSPTASSKQANELRDIRAVLNTDKGDVQVVLYASRTPVTVASFANLAKKGYYDGITFHRVIPGFMIQGGDPTGTGTGGPGYVFEDEFDPSLRHTGAGILSMANPGRPNSNGSQFFITHAQTAWLDGKHTVFGKVISGMDTVMKIQKGDKIRSVSFLDSPQPVLEKEKAKVAVWNSQSGQ